jgi:hypothetical protein
MGYNIIKKSFIESEGRFEFFTGDKDRFGLKTSGYEFKKLNPEDEFEKSLMDEYGHTHWICKDFSDRYVTDKDGNTTYNLFCPMSSAKLLKTKIYWNDGSSSKLKATYFR